jgi:CDP-glycerol glycerophosphotransferase
VSQAHNFIRTKILRGGRWTVRAIMGLARHLTPTRRHAVVYGSPVLEGNAVETVRALLEDYDGEVFWLDGPDWPDAIEGLRLSSPRLKVIPKVGLRAFAAYATAELVFFTHGLFCGAPSPARKTVINLWHGDGIKFKSHVASEFLTADYVVGSTKVLTGCKANEFRVPNILVTGNPRNDAFFETSARAKIYDLLGLEDGQPYVVWFPTYRVAHGRRLQAGWADSDISVSQDGEWLKAQCERHGFHLVVKRHMLDHELSAIDDDNVVFLTDDALNERLLSVTNVLAYSAALLTDFSSVWTDYLTIDRPIGFVASDRDSYSNMRGIRPAEIMDWLPGHWLNTEGDVDRFFKDVRSGGRLSADLRNRSREYLGMVKGQNFGRRLVQALRDNGAIRRETKFTPSRQHSRRN